jgi:PAS domain S-box-containing protein
MTVPDIIYRLDTEGKISFISHSVKRYGYSPEELLGKYIIDIVHQEDRQVAINHLNERRTGLRKTTSLEVRLLSHHKKSRPFEITSKGVDMDPVFLVEAEGLYDLPKKNKLKFLGTQGIARDVTERKIAEQALKASEERLDLAIQGADLGLWDWDLRKNEISYNKQWIKLLGLSSKELSMKSNALEKLIHKDDLPVYKNLMEKHFDKKSALIEAELRFLTKTKEWKWILLRGKVVQWDDNSKPVRFTGTQLDISRRKEAEASLQIFAAAIEQATDSIVLFDTSQKIIYVNPAFYVHTGYEDSEVVNHSLESLHIHETDRASYKDMLEHIKNKLFWEGKLTQLKKNGGALLIEMSLSPIREQDGKISKFVLVQRDISNEEKLSDQLRQAQKMESVGRLAGGIAHDFNNILTVISGYSSLSISKIDVENPLHKNLHQILSASHRAESLTRQLLAFSRKQVLQPKIINLNNTLKDLNKMLYRLIGEDIEFLDEYDENLGQVNVDPGQMEQVVMNLVINARDAMPHGGKLTIRTENKTLVDANNLDLLEAAPGDYVLLTVQDSGMGMDVPVLKQIFEPFFTTKESGKGTGLGLATVYGIIHQSNGFINVASEPGKGATFQIYLPRIDREVDSNIIKTDAGRSLAGKEHIFVVEDQLEVRELLCGVLTEYGYKVSQATDGLHAIQIISQLKKFPDLLLTDVVMPKLKVSELVEKIQTIHANIKILYMSGHTDDVIVHHGVLDENKDFIQKPFSPVDLVRKIRQVLDKK